MLTSSVLEAAGELDRSLILLNFSCIEKRIERSDSMSFALYTWKRTAFLGLLCVELSSPESTGSPPELSIMLLLAAWF